ncbi:MAG: ATP-binding protein [Lachnospiraceae bacterium]|nr:ATP-binding protein [Lachnospiraceae bacterium]
MELIYTYINHFRNIHNQEITFSPTHKIEFKNNTLYITFCDFAMQSVLFTRNHISSIHLIVGKTGSGKTNLLSLLGMSLKERKADCLHNNSCYFILYHVKENTYYLESAGYEISEADGLVLSSESTPRLSSAFFTLEGDVLKTSVYSPKSYTNLTIATLTAQTIIDNPPETLSTKEFGDFLTRVHYSLFNDSRYYTWKHIERYLKSLSNSDSEHFQKYFTCEISLNLYIPTHSVQQTDKASFLSRFKSYVNQDFDKNSRINALFNSTYPLFKALPADFYEGNHLYWKLGKSDKYYETISALMNKLYEWRSFNNSTVSSLFTIKYHYLSSGELQFVSLLSNIERIITLGSNINSQTILLLDEPETYMHPELCRLFLLHLTDLCRELNPCSLFQFVITSHSPFLLSDLPEKCVTCTSIDPETGNGIIKKADFPCFASNIHQLLMNAFFLNSTIGALANQILQNVIECFQEMYSQKINSQEIDTENQTYQLYKLLLPYIGDPVIRHRLEEIDNVFCRD